MKFCNAFARSKICIRKFFSFFIHFKFVKYFHNITYARAHVSFLKKKLLELGYTCKKYKVLNWKCYNKSSIRAVFIIKNKQKQKFLLKVSLGFEEKLENSKKFYSIYNGKFDFICDSKSFNLKPYTCTICKYIDSFDFNYANLLINKTNCSSILEQLLNILIIFSDQHLIHCDFNPYNILFEKKTHKIFLVDFDTIYQENLLGVSVPAKTITTICQNNKMIFDDAYSVKIFLDSFEKKYITENIFYKKICSMVGLNIISFEL